MNDLVEGCKIDGTVLLDGKNVYGDIEVNELRRRVGMVFQKPNPFPMSIYDNIAYGPRTHGIKAKSKLDEIVERSLKQAAIWDETKDRFKEKCTWYVGRSATKTLYCKSTCGRTGSVSLWMNRLRHLTLYPPLKLRIWCGSLRISIL